MASVSQTRVCGWCKCGASVLQCVAVCCSMLQCVQCVAVCCSMLQCVAVCCSMLQCVQCVAVSMCCYCVSQPNLRLWVLHVWYKCVAVCCSVLQYVAVCPVCCSVYMLLLCQSAKRACVGVARVVQVCCSVLQCVKCVAVSTCCYCGSQQHKISIQGGEDPSDALSL